MLSLKQLLFSTAVAVFAAPAATQTTGTFVGLTLSGSGAQFGSDCSPFECRPTPAGFPGGSQITVTSYGAPGTPYAVAVSLPLFGCVRFPNLNAGLVLDQHSLGTVQIGTIGVQPLNACQLGSDSFTLQLPRPLPLQGFAFGIQMVGLPPRTPFTVPLITFSNAFFVQVR